MPSPPRPPRILPPSRVLVAGSTGWLGTAVVRELSSRGYDVVALARDPESPRARELASLASGGSVVVARGDVTDGRSLERAMRADGERPAVSAVVSCVGMRDLAVPDSEIASVLKQGTLSLADALANANSSSSPPADLLLVAVAGGIHRDKGGRVNREMVHNRMREEALEEIAARRRRAEERASASGEPSSSRLLPPAVVAVDPSVFFKDAETIFEMIAKSVKVGGGGKGREGATAPTPSTATPEKKKTAAASLSLVRGSWEVSCNPISARDLASRLADALADGREGVSGGGESPPSPPSLVRRFRVGGPQVLTFAELAEEAGRALSDGGTDVRVARKSIPRPVARALLAFASLLSSSSRPTSPFVGGARRKKALAAKRFLSFLWVVGTDESPGSLVGDEKCGRDTLSAFYAELGEKKKRERAAERENE